MRKAKTWRRPLLILLAVALIGGLGGGVALYVLLYRAPYWAESRFPESAESMVTAFVAQAAPGYADYESLAAYLIHGFVSYATPSYAQAHYPGLPAGGARKAEGLEGFSRIAPLIAVWVARHGEATLTFAGGEVVQPAALLRSALLAGTDPRHPDYWGDFTDRDQRIAEAADVALALWLSRTPVWERLTPAGRARIETWLLQANGKHVADNNWHLFVAQINVALSALGARYDEAAIHTHLARTLEFRRGDGWFNDGPAGPVDYYSAWGFYYHIGWIHRMDPGLLEESVRGDLPRFAQDLVHLVGPHGLPILGRSVCYRLGVAAPLIFASSLEPHSLPAGQARRALDLTWHFFLSRGALRAGRPTQGYCDDEPAILDNYSGPASCLWSARSLVVALSLPPDAEFWRSSPAPLPVELADFERSIAGGHWLARGHRSNGDVVLFNPGPLPPAQSQLQPFGFKDRLIGWLKDNPRRPANMAAKYRRARYGSMEPFVACAK